MARSRSRGSKPHTFRNKLLLNQWMVNLFGIDPLTEVQLSDQMVRHFHLLADPIKAPRLEGLDHDNLHHFYHALVNSELFWSNRGAFARNRFFFMRRTSFATLRRSMKSVTGRWYGNITSGLLCYS